MYRKGKGLTRQKEWIEKFHVKSWLDASFDRLTVDELTRTFMLITAWLITDSALQRTESRGGHFRLDYPCEKNHLWLRTQIIQQRNSRKG